MKLSKLILAALGAATLVTLGATTAASAETEPNLLPEPTAKAPIVFAGASILSIQFKAQGMTVGCETAGSNGEFTSPKSGLMIIEFHACASSGLKCTGLEGGEPVGQIKVHAEIALRRGRLVSASGTIVLHPAVIVFKFLHVHFTCGGVVLALVLGCAAGLLRLVNELAKFPEYELKENEKKSGINDITEIERESGKGEFEPCELRSAINEGKEASALLAGWFELKFFKQSGMSVEVLVMA